MIGQIGDTDEEKYCSFEDLKSCVDALRIQIDRLLFTSENANVHFCLDSLNLLLNIMSIKKVRGFRESQQEELQKSLKIALPALTKKIFNIFNSEVDPSLQ